MKLTLITKLTDNKSDSDIDTDSNYWTYSDNKSDSKAPSLLVGFSLVTGATLITVVIMAQ